MTKRRTFRVDRSRTPLLATTFVLFGGVVACLAIATPFSTDMRYPILIIAGMFLGTALLLGLLRRPTLDVLAELQAIAHEKRKKKVTYKVRKLKPIAQTGPRKPPTAETIREIRGK